MAALSPLDHICDFMSSGSTVNSSSLVKRTAEVFADVSKDIKATYVDEVLDSLEKGGRLRAMVTSAGINHWQYASFVQLMLPISKKALALGKSVSDGLAPSRESLGSYEFKINLGELTVQNVTIVVNFWDNLLSVGNGLLGRHELILKEATASSLTMHSATQEDLESRAGLGDLYECVVLIDGSFTHIPERLMLAAKMVVIRSTTLERLTCPAAVNLALVNCHALEVCEAPLAKKVMLNRCIKIKSVEFPSAESLNMNECFSLKTYDIPEEAHLSHGGCGDLKRKGDGCILM